MPAEWLYTGVLFVAARRDVVERSVPWFILSAKHGLIRPNQNLEPYNIKLTLKRQPAWRRMVFRQLLNEIGSLRGILFEIHAGKLYSGIQHLIEGAGAITIFPVTGKLGERLAKYKIRAAERRA